MFSMNFRCREFMMENHIPAMHDTQIDFNFLAQTDTRAKANVQNMQSEGMGN